MLSLQTDLHISGCMKASPRLPRPPRIRPMGSCGSDRRPRAGHAVYPRTLVDRLFIRCLLAVAYYRVEISAASQTKDKIRRIALAPRLTVDSGLAFS